MAVCHSPPPPPFNHPQLPAQDSKSYTSPSPVRYYALTLGALCSLHERKQAYNSKQLIVYVLFFQNSDWNKQLFSTIIRHLVLLFISGCFTIFYICLSFFFSEGPCVGWGCYLWLLCASGHTHTNAHTYPFTGWKGSHTACKHDFTALGGMSGGGENEDRVQKGKALRFTGPSSQNANHVAAHSFQAIFFTQTQK